MTLDLPISSQTETLFQVDPTRRHVATSILLVFAITLFAGCSKKHQDSTFPPSTSIAPPPEVDIAYGPVAGCSGGGTDDPCAGSQTLDIYRASGIRASDPTEGDPRPVTLWIHGGGFVADDKGGSLSKYYQPLLDDGWDIVAVNYRLTRNGVNTFPTAILDVKRAVRWVKANASVQGWDPATVAAIGHSAGGNLAEMLAVTAGEEALEPTDLPPELRQVDSSITSAVALAAVSDMRQFKASGLFAQVVNDYLGCTEGCDELLDAASVQTHVDPRSRPIMAIHGADDPFAAPSQGKLVQQAYEKAGIANRFRLITVDDGPKDFRGHIPDMGRWIGDVQDWLTDNLPG